MPANLEPGVVRQSSAVNGMVVQLIHPVMGHLNDLDMSDNSTIGVSGKDNLGTEEGRQ